MSSASQEYTYEISVHDFDKSLLPSHARSPNTDAFSEEVSRALRKEYAEFGGWVQIVVNKDTIQVTWKSDPSRPDPHEIAVAKLEQGKHVEAIRILERLRHHEPSNLKLLCNLGMALSDVGELDKAENHLRHALEIDPSYATARVALGVALSREGKSDEAAEELDAAVRSDSSNPWAQRTFAAMLCQAKRFVEGEPHYRKAVELSPGDQQVVLELARCLMHQNKLAEADTLLDRVIEMDSTTAVAEAARTERRKFAEQSFRAGMPTGVRPDAVMYCLGAIQKFETMQPDEVQKIGFEIAVLGQRGLDTNDSTPKYHLKSLPGEFSGLHLVCFMYVAFRQVAPQHDLGFDLSEEYAAAEGMHRAGRRT